MIPTLVRHKAEYMFALVANFAKEHAMSVTEAYNYIKQYNGVQLVDEYYDIMHTLSFTEAADSLELYLRRQGGQL